MFFYIQRKANSQTEGQVMIGNLAKGFMAIVRNVGSIMRSHIFRITACSTPFAPQLFVLEISPPMAQDSCASCCSASEKCSLDLRYGLGASFLSFLSFDTQFPMLDHLPCKVSQRIFSFPTFFGTLLKISSQSGSSSGTKQKPCGSRAASNYGFFFESFIHGSPVRTL